MSAALVVAIGAGLWVAVFVMTGVLYWRYVRQERRRIENEAFARAVASSPATEDFDVVWDWPS